MKTTQLFRIVFLALSLTLTACFRHETTVTDVGVMQYREYWRYDDVYFEQGKALLKSEICPPSGEGCINGQQIRYKESNGVLWVGIYNDYKLDTPPGIYFFDTKTGKPIPCKQCAAFNKNFQVGSVYWLDSGDKLISFAASERQAGLLIAERKAGFMNLTMLARPRPSPTFDNTYGSIVSPDTATFAWFSCSPGCSLHWLANYTEIKSKVTGCDSEYLEVYWKDGVPEIGEFANLTDRLRCHDAAGKLRFPLVERGQVLNPH